VRLLSTLLGTLVGISVMVPPPAAHAEVRSTTFHWQVPSEPPSLEPRPPITQRYEIPESVTLSYDPQAGKLTAHVRLYDAARWHNELPDMEMRLSRSCERATTIDASAEYRRYPATEDEPEDVFSRAALTRDGYDGSAPGTVTPVGDGFIVSFQHAALVGLDMRCAFFSSSYMGGPDDSHGLAEAGYFDGFEPVVLSRANATSAFKGLLAARYGSRFTNASKSWALGPGKEFFPDGLDGESGTAAICMAQFKSGRTWRYVSGLIEDGEDGPVFAHRPWSRTWTRRWRRQSARCVRQAGVRGRLYSNDGTCPSLMVGDIAYTVKQGGRPRYAYWHGTNTAGFEKVARYRCSSRGRTITCRNGLGDAFRWSR
jgi:hypothetical protein